MHPLVLQLTGKKTPQTGLESKFSIYHAASVALIEGAGGVEAVQRSSGTRSVVVALRDRVTAVVNPAIHEDQVRDHACR